MLKITDSGPTSSPRTLKLEGKLLVEWVEEVRCLFADGEPESWPRLDLSSLSYVDRPSAAMLRQLLKAGVHINACSQFVAELLDWNRESNR